MTLNEEVTLVVIITTKPGKGEQVCHQLWDDTKDGFDLTIGTA